MDRYLIDFNNGYVFADKFNNLDEVKGKAYDLMGYTQKDINILDNDGNLVSAARWIGLKPEQEENEDILEYFGNFGYYLQWND